MKSNKALARLKMYKNIHKFDLHFFKINNQHIANERFVYS